MPSLAPFLPRHLLESLSRRSPKTLPWVEKRRAALLFADISGFTALTERLQARGREGAEEISAVINRAFIPAMRSIDRWGGSIVTFGGDALFAIFPGPSPVRRALVAAGEIGEHFERRGEVETSAGRVRLGISQACHFGTVDQLHLGREDRRQGLVSGPAVSALARLEARASAGDVLVSRTAREQRARERAPRRPDGRRPRVPRWLLERYVPHQILELTEHFQGEYRRGVMVFFETRGHAVARLQSFVLSLMDVLDQYGGILVSPDLSAAGTKWLCCFGAPVAHEDDVDRAATAAMELLQRRPKGLGLRGGMHAGTLANIWIGGSRRKSFELMGDVTNTAARAAAKAAWGEMVVTEDVLSQLRAAETELKGTFVAKGKSEPLRLHALKSARVAVKQIRVQAPMIGRDAELRILVDAMNAASLGRGSVIGIRGAAGVGKSRLKYEASRRAAELGLEVDEGRAISIAGMPYWAVAELLRSSLRLPEGSPRDEVHEHIEGASRLVPRVTDRHHLAEILGVPIPGSPIRTLDARDYRRNTLTAIGSFFHALSRERPRLLVVEDMHWADSSSAEVVSWLARDIGSAPMVLLLLYRPGFEPPGTTRELVLDELPESDVADLLAAHLGMVPPHLVALVRERAGGNPFFVEELVRHLLDSGLLLLSDQGYHLVREPGPEDVPGNLEKLIAARLDRLPSDARLVAQHGAVIGRSFLLALLRRLPTVAPSVATGLPELERREVVFEKDPEPRAEYIFKHALTRDVAYASLLAARRRSIHRLVADTIEEVLGPEGFEAMLGFHREQAGQQAPARKAYLAGAQRARSAFAHEEAERLYRRYLTLVESPTAESILAANQLANDVLHLSGRTGDAVELHRTCVEQSVAAGLPGSEAASRRGLGLALESQGHVQEAQREHERSLAIARATGDRRVEALVLGNLANITDARGDRGGAIELYQQALAIFREIGDVEREGLILMNLGVTHEERGLPDEALQLEQQALVLLRRANAHRYVGTLLANMANVYAKTGRADEAGKLYTQALAIHRETGNRREEALVIGYLAIGKQAEGRADDAVTLFEQAIEIAGEAGEPGDLAELHINLGFLRLEKGTLEDVPGHLEKALAIYRQQGDSRGQAIALGRLGSLRRQQGRLEESRPLYEQSLSLSRQIEDRRWEGIVLGNTVHLELLSGDLPRAATLADASLAALQAVGDTMSYGKFLCMKGHVKLATGGAADAEIDEARRIADEAGSSRSSNLGIAIATLARAAANAAARKPLVRGFAPEDVTPGQLRWLRDHDPEALIPWDDATREDRSSGANIGATLPRGGVAP